MRVIGTDLGRALGRRDVTDTDGGAPTFPSTTVDGDDRGRAAVDVGDPADRPGERLRRHRQAVRHGRRRTRSSPPSPARCSRPACRSPSSRSVRLFPMVTVEAGEGRLAAHVVAQDPVAGRRPGPLVHDSDAVAEIEPGTPVRVGAPIAGQVELSWFRRIVLDAAGDLVPVERGEDRRGVRRAVRQVAVVVVDRRGSSGTRTSRSSRPSREASSCRRCRPSPGATCTRACRRGSTPCSRRAPTREDRARRGPTTSAALMCDSQCSSLPQGPPPPPQWVVRKLAGVAGVWLACASQSRSRTPVHVRQASP